MGAHFGEKLRLRPLCHLAQISLISRAFPMSRLHVSSLQQQHPFLFPFWNIWNIILFHCGERNPLFFSFVGPCRNRSIFLSDPFAFSEAIDFRNCGAADGILSGDSRRSVSSPNISTLRDPHKQNVLGWKCWKTRAFWDSLAV